MSAFQNVFRSFKNKHALIFLIKSFVLAFAFLLVFQLSIHAAGISLAVSDGSGVVDGGPGGDTELSFSWESSGFYATGTQMTFTISPATSSTISNCSVPASGFGGSFGSFGSFTTSSAIFTLAENVSTSTLGSLCLRMNLTNASATNYSISMRATTSTSGFSTTDYGAVLYYVLGGNEIQVSATVASSLSFSIRNTSDTANANSCDLGTLSITDINYCEYRLRISTNAAGGFSATVQSSGSMTSGLYNLDDIANDGSFLAGTEAYGIAQLIGATTGGKSGLEYNQPISEASATDDASITFNVDTSPLSFTNATTIVSYPGPFDAGIAPNTDTTTLIRHGISIGSNTERGNYSQVITYRVTGSF